MEKKVCMIICYFGKLPNYFELWLNSCKYNETIDFFLITDDKSEYNLPKNVQIKYYTLEELKTKIQEKLKIKISLESSYKLCDYKVTYGEIFSEFLKNYDYWGHCDLDIIFGDLKKYLNHIDIDKYDKIFSPGHFTLYRNNMRINESYKLLMDSKGEAVYKDVFSKEESFFFDEWGKNGEGILNFWIKNKEFKIYIDKSVVADISIKYNKLIPIKYNKLIPLKNKEEHIFRWSNHDGVSKLDGYYIEDGKLKKREYMYIHLQKRKMKYMNKYDNNYNEFLIVPNKFIINVELNNIMDFKKLNYKVTLIRKEYIKLKLKNFYSNYLRRKGDE